MSVYPDTPENIRKAAELLLGGSLVAFPTETVYGLGCDALNSSAVARIFEVKNRPFFDPLIVHAASYEEAAKWAVFSKQAERLAKKFWPGPLTLVLPKKEGISDLVTSGLPTVAMRVPEHPSALEMIRQAGRPVAAPSANPFGYLSPTTAKHVADQLESRVEMILDGGPCRTGVESTIVECLENEIRILRPGGVSREELEAVVGRVLIAEQPAKPNAPGQLLQHYAPRIPLDILERQEILKHPKLASAGVLFACVEPENLKAKAIEVLSSSGDLRESAARLFVCLHSLEASGAERIFAEPVAQTGLGLAIMDRLKRASASKH